MELPTLFGTHRSENGRKSFDCQRFERFRASRRVIFRPGDTRDAQNEGEAYRKAIRRHARPRSISPAAVNEKATLRIDGKNTATSAEKNTRQCPVTLKRET